MSIKRSKGHKSTAALNIAMKPSYPGRRSSPGGAAEKGLTHGATEKTGSSANKYVCAVEKTQNGRYNIRIRAAFGESGWILPVYFLTSSFHVAMKKLEEALQYLQKNEARLRFWGQERTDDPTFAGELLQESGLGLDRRKDLPRKTAELEVTSERPVTASVLGPVRRFLSDSITQERAAAAAGD
jgi:hypothetical protein